MLDYNTSLGYELEDLINESTSWGTKDVVRFMNAGITEEANDENGKAFEELEKKYKYYESIIVRLSCGEIIAHEGLYSMRSIKNIQKFWIYNLVKHVIFTEKFWAPYKKGTRSTIHEPNVYDDPDTGFEIGKFSNSPNHRWKRTSFEDATHFAFCYDERFLTVYKDYVNYPEHVWELRRNLRKNHTETFVVWELTKEMKEKAKNIF